ncbi:FAD-dependent monooxygenase [Aurantimonas sp. A2-1-M11]|uniref:FAD-dependent oxidoreductase n=1 Tax=Aurantimonas sp. A2-1-M11 TaxID=3113712 RepID=UPI002F91D0C2
MTARCVLIAGAGPVGLAAAVEFRRRGFSPRIVDAGEGPTPDDQSRALGVLPRTLDILAASGIALRMLAEGNRISRMAVTDDGRPLFEMTTTPGHTQHPFILALPQGRTERLMIEWLAAHDVEIEWGVGFQTVADTHVPRVTLSTDEIVAADIVVGADGAHSAVREDIGISWSGDGYPAGFALADVVFDRPIDPAVAKIDLRTSPGHLSGAIAMLPLGERHGRYVGIAPSTEALLGDLPGIGEVVWASRFHVSFRHAERMAKGRVFLAGDAAHVHSPVGGRGMNLGIEDAATLAFLASEDRETEYEMRRLPSVRKVMAATRQGTDFIAAPPPAALALLRVFVPVAGQTPWLRGRIADRILGLDLPPPEWLRQAG